MRRLLVVLSFLTAVIAPLPAVARVADRPEDKPKANDRPTRGETSDPVGSYEPPKPERAPKPQAGDDTAKAGGSGNGKAGDDHGKSGQDNGKAGQENGKAGEDHGKAGQNGKGAENGQAGDEHGKAGDGGRPAVTRLDGHAEPPAVARRVVATPAGPPVFVRLPGRAGVQQLTAEDDLPVGAVVDTTHGAIVLRSALPGGKEQVAAFHGGRFEVRQSRDGMVDLHLRGSGPDCGGARAARADGKGRRRGAPKRLWGYDDHGRFRTFGRDSVATVRGTAWMVEERCDGTLTKVLWGAVDVRDRRTGRVVRVRAGESHLARRAR